MKTGRPVWIYYYERSSLEVIFNVIFVCVSGTIPAYFQVARGKKICGKASAGLSILGQPIAGARGVTALHSGGWDQWFS